MQQTLKTIFLGSVMSAVSFSAMAETVTVNGSTTVLPAMQVISEAFMKAHPEIKVSISGGGSGHGVKALMEGTTDVAMSSRDLKSAEKQAIEKAGKKAVKHVVAIDAIVPVVHPKNAVQNISLEKLRDVYAGRITNWKELGGADARIVVISRDSASGTFETWEGMVMKGERVQNRALLQASNGAVVQTVAKNPNAIGYVGFGYLGDSIKALDVNGVKATMKTAETFTWPLSRELYLFSGATPKSEAQALIDYAKSTQGQAAVKSVGFVPVPKH